MIRSQSFSRAAALYQSVMDIDEHRVVAPIPNTPVSMLTAPVLAPALFFDAASSDYQSVSSITSLLERNATVTDGVDTHQQTADQFTEMAKEAVNNTVYLTKTVALPIISEVVNKIEEDLDAISGCAGLALTISAETQDGILDDSILQNALEDFSLVAREDTRTVNLHRIRTGDEIVQLLATGHQDFDRDVIAWVKPYHANGMLEQIYRFVFGSNESGRDIGKVFAQSHRSYPEALICFLLARHLMQEMDDDLNTTATQYESLMSMVLNYAAITLQRAIEYKSRARRRDVVVLRYPGPNEEGTFSNPSKGVIMVCKANYDKFLEAGGSPEVIMGSYLNSQDTTKDQLLESKDAHIRSYNARVKKLSSDNELAKLLTLRRNLERYLSDEIAKTLPNVVGTDRGVWQGIELNPEKAQRKLRKAIDMLSYHNLTEIYVTVRKVLVSIFFEDTDVEQLLTLIDNNESKSERDLQSAVNLAILDYIVDWLMLQTKLTRA